MEDDPPAVRDERLRARADDPARPPEDARAALGQDREHQLDGGELHVPGRRLLPRDQARGRRADRRAALRGQGLRDRRDHHPARADHDQLRRRGRRLDAERDRAATARTGSSTRSSRRRRRASTRRGRRRSSAAARTTVAKAIEKAITARRPKARYLVTPSAHLLVNQKRLMPDRVVGPLPAHAVPPAEVGLRTRRSPCATRGGGGRAAPSGPRGGAPARSPRRAASSASGGGRARATRRGAGAPSASGRPNPSGPMVG